MRGCINILLFSFDGDFGASSVCVAACVIYDVIVLVVYIINFWSIDSDPGFTYG